MKKYKIIRTALFLSLSILFITSSFKTETAGIASTYYSSYATQKHFIKSHTETGYTLKTQKINGDMETFINSINIPVKGNSNAFIRPSLADLAVWSRIITLTGEGKYEEASFLADAQNYEAINFTHSDNKMYFILKEKPQNFRGLGTYIFNPEHARNIILEVPHPINDRKTREQGVKAFFKLQAQALLIAGTYRCSNCQESYFEGTTTVCNSACSLPSGANPYRISDVAHNKFNFFHETHETLSDLNPEFYYIQLHGATNVSLGLDADNEQVDVILTRGTNEAPVASNLILKLDQELDSRSLNSRVYGIDTARLGGSTNLQGRYTNGRSVEGCNTPCSANGHFIHIEQDLELRNSPQPIIEALAATFPENR